MSHNQIMLILIFIQTIIFTVTLIFIAWQSKQIRKSIKSSVYTNILKIIFDIRNERIINPNLAKIMGSKESWSPEEIVEYNHVLQCFGMFEIVFLEFINGNIDEEDWKHWDKILKDVIIKEEKIKKYLLTPGYLLLYIVIPTTYSCGMPKHKNGRLFHLEIENFLA